MFLIFRLYFDDQQFSQQNNRKKNSIFQCKPMIVRFFLCTQCFGSHRYESHAFAWSSTVQMAVAHHIHIHLPIYRTRCAGGDFWFMKTERSSSFVRHTIRWLTIWNCTVMWVWVCVCKCMCVCRSFSLLHTGALSFVPVTAQINGFCVRFSLVLIDSSLRIHTQLSTHAKQ